MSLTCAWATQDEDDQDLVMVKDFSLKMKSVFNFVDYFWNRGHGYPSTVDLMNWRKDEVLLGRYALAHAV
jgi:hypothetical protein